MADEPHDVVKLIVKRMESHPDEFSTYDGRWAQWLDELMPFVTEEERVMLRKPMMQTIHEDVMDELLNGPERRAKEKEDTEYERHLEAALRQTKQQALLQQAQQKNAYGQYQNAMAAAQGLTRGGGGASLPVSTSPYQNAAVQGIIGKSPTSIVMDESASIGPITDIFAASLPKPTTINQIKKALGIKK